MWGRDRGGRFARAERFANGQLLGSRNEEGEAMLSFFTDAAHARAVLASVQESGKVEGAQLSAWFLCSRTLGVGACERDENQERTKEKSARVKFFPLLVPVRANK